MTAAKLALRTSYEEKPYYDEFKIEKTTIAVFYKAINHQTGSFIFPHSDYHVVVLESLCAKTNVTIAAKNILQLADISSGGTIKLQCQEHWKLSSKFYVKEGGLTIDSPSFSHEYGLDRRSLLKIKELFKAARAMESHSAKCKKVLYAVWLIMGSVDPYFALDEKSFAIAEVLNRLSKKIESNFVNITLVSHQDGDQEEDEIAILNITRHLEKLEMKKTCALISALFRVKATILKAILASSYKMRPSFFIRYQDIVIPLFSPVKRKEVVSPAYENDERFLWEVSEVSSSSPLDISDIDCRD